MALVRAVPLKNASTVVLSSGDNGTIFDLSGIFTSGATQKLYAGLHLITTCSTAAGPDSFQAFIQSASSSGANFGTLATTEIIFAAMTSRDGVWNANGNGSTAAGIAAISSTDRKFFRTRWTLSTASNAPGVSFITWVALR